MQKANAMMMYMKMHSVSAEDSDRCIKIDSINKVCFSVKDGNPTLTIGQVIGFGISGTFDPEKNPLQALLNNFSTEEK